MGTRSIFIILKVNRDQSIANMALEFWKPIWDDNYSWKHLKIASNRDQFPPAIGLVLLFELPQMTIGLPESKHVLSSEKPELDSLSTECITLAFLKFSGPVCVRSFNHSEGPEGGPSLVWLTCGKRISNRFVPQNDVNKKCPSLCWNALFPF